MRSFLFLHFAFVGTAEFTETEATAFCCLVSVLNVLHENLGIICECSSAIILVGVLIQGCCRQCNPTGFMPMSKEQKS